MPSPQKLDLGIIAEGIVELDPMTGRHVIRVVQPDGSNTFVDVQEQLAKYNGQDVRLIVTPLETVSQLAGMVERGEISMDAVQGLKPS